MEELRKVKMDTDGFPSDLVPDEQKSRKEFSLAWGKAIWGAWNGMIGGLPTFEWARFDRLRLMSSGIMDTTRFKRAFPLPQGRDGKRGDGQASNTIDDRVFAVQNKYVRIAYSILTESPATVEVLPGDPDSMSKMQRDKYIDLSKVMRKKFFDEALGAAGISNERPAEQPQTPEQVIMYEMQGGYRPAFTSAMQAALYASMSANRMDEKFESIARKDVIPVGICATSTHVDSGVVRTKRVPPENLVLPYSDDDDFSDARHAGALHDLTLAEIRQMAGDSFSEDEYLQIQQLGMTWNSNDPQYMNGALEQRIWNRAGGKIRVLEFYYYTTNKVNYREKTTASGNRIVEPRSSSWEPNENNSTVSSIRTDYKCVYQGWWIVGSDFIYNYGKMPNQPMNALGDARLPIKVSTPCNIKMQWMSMIEEIAPDIDMVQVAYRKWLHIVSRIQPDGIAILDSWLNNTEGADGVYLKKADLLKNFMATGVLSLNPPNPEYDSYGGTGIPIVPIPMSQREPMLAATEALLTAIQHIEMKLGFNDATNGSNADKDSLVRIQQMQQQGTVNAMKPFIRCLDRLMEMTADVHCSAIIQCARGGGNDDYWTGLVGEEQWDTIKRLAYSSTLSSINVKTVRRASVEDRMLLDQAAIEAQKMGQIEYEDLVLVKMLARTNWQKANWLFAAKKNKRMREAIEAQSQQMQQQMQAEQQAIAAASEAKNAEIQSKAQADVMKSVEIMNAKLEAKLTELQQSTALTDSTKVLESQLRIEEMMRKMMVESRELEKDREHEEDLEEDRAEARLEEIELAAKVAPRPQPQKK